MLLDVLSAGVLLIVVDDAGPELMQEAPTPQVDALVQQGLSFGRVWTAPSCSPWRSMVASGMYGHRDLSLVGRSISHQDWWSLPTTGVLLADVVQGPSGFVGKWHLGHETNQATHPLDAGFAHWWGTNFNLNPQTGTYYGGECWDDGQPSMWSGYLTEVEGEKAVERIGAGDALVWLSLHAVHSPWEAPPDHLHSFGDLSEAKRKTKALAMLEAADWVIGRVAAYALARGYTVIVTGDNGTAKAIGGEKTTLSESSLRGWVVVAGPGVRAGQMCWELVDAVDLYATITELTNGAPASSVDSVSFAPCLYDPFAENGREFQYAQKFEPNGTPPDPQDPAWERVIRDERWKLWLNGAIATALYDLEADPDEQTNLMDGDLTDEEQAAVDRLLELLP